MKPRSLIIPFILLSLVYSDGYSQLHLNEVMSKNYSIIEDQFAEYPDWIELHNSGIEDIYLGNYYLSDDNEELLKWSLPPVILPEDAYMLFYASGRDLQSNPSYWHTIVNAGDEWRYLVPETDIGNSWKSSADATTDWSVGKSGIGYEDGDDSTTIGKSISLYMQYIFDISDRNTITNAAFFMDYDDGFIAYLNGTEIARSSSMGESGVEFSFDAPSLSGHEALMYNGSPPESFYLTNQLDLLQEGENVLSVEVHNVSSSSSDMTATPFLLIGFNRFNEQYISGNQYIEIANEYSHTNFKISSEGESIYLSDAAGLITDSIPRNPIPIDCSYGRNLHDETQFVYFKTPTPGSENNTSFTSGYIVDSVKLEIVREESDTCFLQMITQNEHDTIYYTTDGSVPDTSSTIFTEELGIGTTQVIRARILRSAYLPGPVSTRTIFTGRKHDIPRFSVSTDPENLWDYYTGLYVAGPDAQADWPYWGANFWKDWEKPAHIEIYDVDGRTILSQDAGIQIYGGSTRCLPQKPFSFHARSKYGDGSFSAKLFKEKDIDEFESFILRNDGGDWNQGMFRDAISGHIAEGMDVDRQGYQPVVLYLNGQYWGIMNMREKLNEHFVASNHQVHTEDVNMFQDNASLMEGDRTGYDALENYVRTHDLSVDEHYQHMKGIMDVNNYIRYWLLEVYLDNWDWPQHNIKFFSTQAPGSLFRWILYDTDFCYDLPAQATYRYNTLKFSMGIESEHPWINADWSNLLFNGLIANEEFRYSFINQMADRMNYNLLPENILPVVDSFKQQIRIEAPYHFDKWGGTVNNWYSNLSRIQNFVYNRATYMREILIDQFDLSTTSNITVQVSDPVGGSVRVNTIVPEDYPFEGIYFTNVPIQLEAIPAPGYRFSNWLGTVNSDYKTINFDMNSAGTFMAVFEELPDAEIDIVINEINYSSAPEKNSEDWVELYNHSEISVDLTGWKVADSPAEAGYIIPPGTVLLSDSYMVISRNIPDFKRFYPERQPLFGNFEFGLSQNGDAVYLFNEFGEIQDHVVFESELPWPIEANGTGATLELRDPNLDNTLPGSWIASSMNGTPCMKNSNFVGIEDSFVENAVSSSARLFPSVFHDLTTIEYESLSNDHVHISVVSMSGQVIDVLANHILPSGNHRFNWIPSQSGAEPGMYFIRIETSETIHTLKAIYH